MEQDHHKIKETKMTLPWREPEKSWLEEFFFFITVFTKITGKIRKITWNINWLRDAKGIKTKIHVLRLFTMEYVNNPCCLYHRSALLFSLFMFIGFVVIFL